MIVEFAEYKRGRPPLTPLQKLFNFLKKKGLKVEYAKERGFHLEHISGDDFLIYSEGINFYVEQMYDLKFNEKGERCGSWKKIYFQSEERFENIYELVKDIAEINDLEIDANKYNL